MPETKQKPFDYPLKHFKDAPAWRAWLAAHHAKAPGLWLVFYKKQHAGKAGLGYDGALLEALCYGWIDGQARGIDEDSYAQKFTPRRVRSLWSARNKKLAAGLIKAGKMTAAGRAAIAEAKRNGRWAAAYATPTTAVIPPDFLAAAKKHKKAWATLEGYNKANRFAIAWRLATASTPEVRARRFAKLLDTLKRGKRIHE